MVARRCVALLLLALSAADALRVGVARCRPPTMTSSSENAAMIESLVAEVSAMQAGLAAIDALAAAPWAHGGAAEPVEGGTWAPAPKAAPAAPAFDAEMAALMGEIGD